MLPPGMESTAEAVLMVGEGIRVSGKDSPLTVFQHGGGLDFFFCDQRQPDSWNVSVWKREIGHSGKRVFTKAGIACGTYNIQPNKNSPWAISRLDDSGLSIMRAEIWAHFGEAIFSGSICSSEEFDMRKFNHKVRQCMRNCLSMPA